MASSNSIFGWNLLYSSIESDVRCNEDILFCLSHLILVTNGFQCIGIGDSKNMDGTEPKTETLPKGWNEAYSLRYVYQGKLYIMQGTKLDDGIMINLIRADERNVSLVQLNSRSVVKRKGTIDEMIPNNQDIVKTIKDHLIDKVTTSTKTRTTESQTNPQPQQQQQPIGRPTPSSESVLYDFGGPGRGFPIPPVGVGRNDLDPFPDLIVPPAHSPRGSLGPILPGGGGMLFQPPSPGNPLRTGLPRGGVPPGARFDPFRPPDVDRWQPPRRNNPDNDEMQPPGYDDMYM